jgi:hypothetical protein
MNVVADPHKLSVTAAALVLAAGYSTTPDYSAPTSFTVSNDGRRRQKVLRPV